MNYQDRTVGGGLPSLLGHGDVAEPGAFAFAQRSEPVVRYAVGGNVSGYQGQEDPYGLDQNLFMPQTQQAPQQPVVPQPPATPFSQQQMLDLGQRNPVVRPDVQPTVAPVQAPGGRYERRGQGEDAYDEWVPDEPQAQPYAGTNTDMAFWAGRGKLGYTGSNPYVYDEVADEGGTRSSIRGTTKEFDDWLAQNPGFTTQTVRDGDKGTQYLLDPKGNVVDSAEVDLGKVGFLDKLANVMPTLILSAALPGVGTALGTSLSAAAQGAIAGGLGSLASSGGDLKAGLKGAALGGLGGAASGYLNPAAAEFGKAIGGGNEFLTKLATDAASGAGRGLVGSALTGGKNLGESVLMGAAGSALGGAANTAMGEAAGAAGIPPEVMRVLGPTAMAALTNKDWRLAGLTSLLGAAAQSAGKQPIATTQADFTEQWYPSDYPVEKDQQLLGGSPLVGGMSLASIQPALDALDAAGQKVDLTDIGKLIAGQTWGQETPENPDAFIDTHDEGYEADPDKFVDGLINQMYNRDKGDLEDRQLLKGMGNVFGDGNLEEDYVVDQDGNVRSTYTGEAGTFVDGKWVPKYTAPTQKTAPTKATTPTKPAVTPTTPAKPTTSSGGGLDMNSLMALLALMGGGEQQAAPAQPLFRSDLDVNKIFKNWMA